MSDSSFRFGFEQRASVKRREFGRGLSSVRKIPHLPDKMQNHPGKTRGGAITLEAALVLPVLLCAFLSVIFLIKVVYAYELVNHAMNEAASEIASAGYIYHVSGLKDIHDTVRDGMNEKSDVFREQLDSVFGAYTSLSGLKESLGSGTGGISDGLGNLRDAGRNFDEMISASQAAAADPVEELKSIACYIAAGAFDDAKTQLFIPVLKLSMKKYFITEEIPDADKRLKLLNIEGGMDGLDFSRSSFLSDQKENIDLVVRYRIKLPLPVPFLPSVNVEQRTRVKVWMGGDESRGVLDGSQSTDDLWSLSNFQRGLKIRRLFGANLPANFPVIARFSGGKAVMIKSVDLTAGSYQKGDNAQKLLMGYLKELSRFKGQEKPWGSRNIVIRNEDIKSRELLLVIPQNKLSEANEKLLAVMAKKAEAQGVQLTVKRYGTKAEKKSEDSVSENAASESNDGESSDSEGNGSEGTDSSE